MATGTTIPSYRDREYLFRLQTLIIDGGTEVLRNMFNHRLKSQPLRVVLASELTTINRLRVQKAITPAQYDLLYPSGGRLPSSSDFDITLIVCLLRNLPSFGLNQKYAWNVPPALTDMTVEADVCRLKAFRNEIAHISSTTGFQKSTFNARWIEIEQVLLRLNISSSNPLPNLKQTIDSYRNSSMDPVAEQRIQTILEQWTEMDRITESVKRDVQKIKQDVKAMKQNVEVIEEDLKGIKKGLRTQEDPDTAYDKLKSNLQNDLISFYKRQFEYIPLSPLVEEDQPFLEFFVMTDVVSVNVVRSRDGDREVKTPLITLRDIFYQKNKRCSNIYLTADAGFGKTAFSKKLALAWCHAKKYDKSEDRHFSRDEITSMCQFRFVFLVLLRESFRECDIDMLILNQICSQLSHDYNLEDLRKILCEETCLVILDGLDEWTHPLNSCRQGESNIPHQRVRENVTVLTTTRPWKLCVIGLHSSQIDHKIELKELSYDSASKLKRSVISHLYGEQDKNKLDAYEDELNITLNEKHISDLASIPLFLIYFIFLWYYRYNVGKSLADLYKNILVLLLSRTVEKDRKYFQKDENVQGHIPPCFADSRLCNQFYTLLTCLGELAFQTLFSVTKENTLVFDDCVAEQYLNKDDFKFSLKAGVITQSKVQGASLVEGRTKVSFAHKTVQEFLAALYMTSAPNQRLVQEIVKSKCKCAKDILDMSKIFIFIVGINWKLSFSQELIKIINEDKITQEYRNSLQERVTFFQHPLQDIQDMCISCCEEIPRENEVNVDSLCLQDVFIDSRCQEEEYCENLKRLTTRNKHNIRSVYINMPHMEYTPYNTTQKLTDYFELFDLENIETIHYKGGNNDDDNNDVILPLLNTSVKCLSLLGDVRWQRSLSCCVLYKVASLQKLEAINISWFSMNHSELSLLLGYISQRDSMREIELAQLDCTDHKNDACAGLSVDLSNHLSLRTLTLYRLCLSKVTVNMESLEKCSLRYLHNQDLSLIFSNCAGSKLNTFICNCLRSSLAIDVVLDTLRLSHHVRHVELTDINLDTKTLAFSSDFLNIEKLVLSKVTMGASTFRVLVDALLKLQRTVSVEIRDCTISPREEFEIVKEKVKTLRNFRIH